MLKSYKTIHIHLFSSTFLDHLCSLNVKHIYMLFSRLLNCLKQVASLGEVFNWFSFTGCPPFWSVLVDPGHALPTRLGLPLAWRIPFPPVEMKALPSFYPKSQGHSCILKLLPLFYTLVFPLYLFSPWTSNYQFFISNSFDTPTGITMSPGRLPHTHPSSPSIYIMSWKGLDGKFSCPYLRVGAEENGQDVSTGAELYRPGRLVAGLYQRRCVNE